MWHGTICQRPHCSVTLLMQGPSGQLPGTWAPGTLSRCCVVSARLARLGISHPITNDTLCALLVLLPAPCAPLPPGATLLGIAVWVLWRCAVRIMDPMIDMPSHGFSNMRR